MSAKDIEYTKRLIRRYEVVSLHNAIKGICSQLDYPYDMAFIDITNNFYGNSQNDKIFKAYSNKSSPINRFSLNTLTYYKQYLNNIIENYENNTTVFLTNSDKRTIFKNAIIDEAEKIRKTCKENNALPENNDNAEQLPKITSSILKQSIKMICEILNREQAELFYVKEKLNNKLEKRKLHLQLDHYLDLDKIFKDDEVRDLIFNIHAVDDSIKENQKNLDYFENTHNLLTDENELVKNKRG